ncbi:MAG: ABC transporter ATP-binding protein [Solirubrobacteraceae bacterium]
MEGPPVLELCDVKRHFGGIRAVDGVTMAISEGAVVAVIGPNGAGKSTLFALLMGELAMSEGTISLDGRDMRGLSPERRARLGLGRTFQTPRLFGGLTVEENFRIVLFARRSRVAVAGSGVHEREALGEVGLLDQAGVLAGSLSQGQRKRLELAMVLALEPRILLLDEPTAGMGVGERATIMKQVMAAVERRGLTMVFCEHDMETVFAYAQRVVVMDRGTLVADGPPESVRVDPLVQEVYLGRHPGRRV